MQPVRSIFLILLAILFFGADPASQAAAAPADSVVGDGSAASCDGNALEAAINRGGVVTFDCGGAHTILANTMVVDSALTVVVDGGGLITISGEDLRQIFIVNAGASLTLNNITLSDGNWPGRGGAVVVYGNVTLNNSTVRDSFAPCQVCNGSDGIGGALAVEDGGVLSINNSQLLNNQAASAGGALGLFGGAAAVADSIIDGNRSGSLGGGVWTNDGAVLTLTGSRVSNNEAASGNGGSGGGLLSRGDTTIVRSTFNANLADDGGALVVRGGNLRVENSTISGNRARVLAGGVRFGLPPGAGSARLINDTLYGNVVVNVDNVSSNANVYIDGQSAAPIFQNSVIAGSVNGSNCVLGVAPQSLGYNLASDGSCGLTGAGDRQSVTLLLDTLKDNGGPTQTHLPFVGSPVVDAVPAANCPVSTDQRGILRPQGPNCDAGAVEEIPTTQPPLPITQPYYLGKLLVRPINLPIFAIKPNIAATQLEITQGIQEADGLGVTLVAGKRTFVRFHVQKTSGFANPIVGARLWRIVNGQRVGDPILPSARPGLYYFLPIKLGGAKYIVDPTITVLSSPDRNALSDSFFFRLPTSWTAAGALTVEAEVNPTFLPNAVDEATRSDNTLRTSMTFVDTPRMVLRLFSVRYRTNDTVYAPTETQLREVEDWLRRAYPISRLTVIRDSEDMTSLNRIPTCDEVNGRLFWDNLFLKWAGIDAVPTRYFGLVADASSAVWMRGCAADIPSFIASGPTGDPNNHSFSSWDKNNDGESFGDWYTGHELAHTWGRSHVSCRGDEGGPDAGYPMGESGSIGRKDSQNKYWGFDIYLRGPVVYPPTWKDVMTYCDNQWISAYTYEAIRNRLASENAAAALASTVDAPLADYLVIQGSVTPAGPSATLDEIYRLSAPSVLADSAPGVYSIRLIGADGSVLADYPFTPRADTEDPDDLTKPLLVMEQVPFVAGATQIQIVYAGATVLAARAVSANAPTVAVVTPAGGEIVDSAGLTVNWSASDADGDALVATVLYSRDGGASYAPLRLHLTGSSVVIPLAELGGTTQGKVRVIVSDGVNTGQADSAGIFSAPNQPPAAQIVTPEEGATFGYGQVVPLAGVATDREDVTLPDSAFTWYSDLDGLLGAGASLDASLETIGVHTLTLQVTDGNGAVGTAQRTVAVSDDVMVAAAALVVAPPATNFVASVGSTAVQTQTLSLRNPDGSALAWQASSNAAWLSVAAASGVTPADPDLRVDPSGLATGDYTAMASITGSGPGGALPVQQVRVSLTVTGATTTLQNIYLPVIRN